MVEYIDNSVIAQMSVPDMRHCVQYALTHPHRTDAGNTMKKLDLFAKGSLTFARPDKEVFGLLGLAFSCIEAGGALPAALNAANEVAVAAFLKEKISFSQISETVSRSVDIMKERGAADIYTLDGILETDADARRVCEELI